MLWAMVRTKVIGYFYFLGFGQYTIDYEQKTNKIIFFGDIFMQNGDERSSRVTKLYFCTFTRKTLLLFILKQTLNIFSLPLFSDNHKYFRNSFIILR